MLSPQRNGDFEVFVKEVAPGNRVSVDPAPDGKSRNRGRVSVETKRHVGLAGVLVPLAGTTSVKKSWGLTVGTSPLTAAAVCSRGVLSLACRMNRGS